MNGMRRWAIVGGIVAGLVTGAAAESTETFSYVGYAHDPESGELLYTENHEETRVDGEPTVHAVEYRAADGSLIATKTIDYRKSRTYPDFRMEDVRDGYLEGGELVDGTYRLFQRTTGADEIESGAFEVPNDFVADAGFNQFIRLEWERLLTGDPITLHFAVPGRQDFYRFRAQLIERTTYEGRAAGVFRVEIDNWLLRRLVDPIVLTYDLETTELLEFAGVANVNDPNGKSYVARIAFPEGQPPAPETVASAAAESAAPSP